jgi:hypothetical protein
MKKLILDFLQEKALDLRQAYADQNVDVIEANLIEDPPRLGVVLSAVPSAADVVFEFRGVKIVPEIVGYEPRDYSQAVTIQVPEVDQQVGAPQQTRPVRDNEFHSSFVPGCPPVLEGKEGEQVVAPEASPTETPVQPEELVYHPFSQEQAKALGISEAPNPHSVDPRTGKTAFAIWKERHEKGSGK